MKTQKLRGKHIKGLGIKDNTFISMSIDLFKKHFKHDSLKKKLKLISQIHSSPENYIDDALLSKLANYLIPRENKMAEEYHLENEKAFEIYGDENIGENAKHQMHQAMKLPISLEGALMPDSHHGYGLPIGGVLATNNAVIPYGVGVDIGCRMCLSIFEDSPIILDQKRDELKKVLKEHTKFGLKETHEKPNHIALLDHHLFKEIPLLKKLQSKAAFQLGSSGGGNHFVEFGLIDIPEDSEELNLKKGEYFGLLSHSGSRGLGANIAQHYTQLAKQQTKLPKGVQNLAWLDLDSQEGQEYWLAMNLAGDYASACHHDIHRRITKVLRLNVKTVVENHHNFAWKEVMADGTEAIVHRKGATPAGEGVLGVIPGSMTAPGFIVKGKGEQKSINSASHGAGRQMSRSAAKQRITKESFKKVLKDHGVELLGGGLDEAPMAYKNIDEVMQHQQELVEVLGSFTPKIVRMAKD